MNTHIRKLVMETEMVVQKAVRTVWLAPWSDLSDLTAISTVLEPVLWSDSHFSGLTKSTLDWLDSQFSGLPVLRSAPRNLHYIHTYIVCRCTDVVMLSTVYILQVLL